MIVRCEKCKRKYRNSEDAELCRLAHLKPFKYENDCEALVLANGIKGVISRPVRLWDGEHKAICLIHKFSTPASKTGSNFYYFFPLDASLCSKNTCIHEDDITEILVPGATRIDQLRKLIEDSKKIREEYGKPKILQSYLDDDGFYVERNYYDGFVIYIDRKTIKKMKDY